MTQHFSLVEQRFQVLDLEEHFGEMIVDCPDCGFEFVIDTETTENMVYNFGSWKIRCPKCGLTD